VAAGLLLAFGVTSFVTAGAVAAYGAAMLVGALTGLFVGKPIWAKDGRIEAALKAFFGALLATGAMAAARRWLGAEVDLGAVLAALPTEALQWFSENVPELFARAPAHALPVLTLPAIAALLGALFGADDTPDAPTTETKPPPQRAHTPRAARNARPRVAASSAAGRGPAASSDVGAEEDGLEDALEQQSQGRKGRAGPADR
jgi:hypothetical protein